MFLSNFIHSSLQISKTLLSGCIRKSTKKDVADQIENTFALMWPENILTKLWLVNLKFTKAWPLVEYRVLSGYCTLDSNVYSKMDQFILYSCHSSQSSMEQLKIIKI